MVDDVEMVWDSLAIVHAQTTLIFSLMFVQQTTFPNLVCCTRESWFPNLIITPFVIETPYSQVSSYHSPPPHCTAAEGGISSWKC